MTICNLYAPNTDTPKFFQKVVGLIENLRPDSMIIMGDFNTTLLGQDRWSEKKNVEPGHPNCSRFIREIMEKLNLLDIWRQRHPTEHRYTWFRKNPYKLLERLDIIIVSANLSAKILDADIDPTYLSDHAIPHITFSDLQASQKGPGYWKLNVNHLYDKNYLEVINNIIDKCTQEYVNIETRWEMIKMQVRGASVQFGTRKKKAIRNEFEALETKLYQVTKDRDNQDSLFRDHEDQIMRIQNDLDKIIQQHTFRRKLENDAMFHAFGEKNTSYFFQLGNRFP